MNNTIKDTFIKGFSTNVGGTTNSEPLTGTPKKSRLPHYIGLFLISPVLAVVSGISNFRKRSAKVILVLFVGVVGYNIIFTPGKDSYTIMETFLNHYVQLSLMGFIEELTTIMTFQSTGITVDEPYLSIISYTVAQFTNNPRWLFTVLALVYGFLYIKGISLVYSEVKGRWNLTLSVLVLFFITWVTLDGINAPRTYTAAWFLFCGGFLYYKTLDKRYLLWVLMAPLVHIGYLAIIMPFFVYMVLKDKKYFYVVVLTLSFFMSAHMSFLEPVLTATELGETKMQQYSGEGWEARLQEEASRDRSFHAEYYRKASDFALQFMIIGSILFSGYLTGKHHDRLQNALGGIAILLLSASNFIEPVITVLGNRLFVSFGLFALAYLIRLYAQHYQELKNRHWILQVCFPAIFLFLFTKWSMNGDFLDFKALISPLFYPFLGDDPVSMKEFLREVLGI